MTKFFVAVDPRGNKHTRSSQNRTYSHTVVALPSYDSDMKLADVDHKVDGDNWEFACKMVAWGGSLNGERRSWETDESLAETVARYKLIADMYVSREAAIAGRRADRVRGVNALVSDGHYSRWQNLGWCSRLDLAVKLANSERSRGRWNAIEWIVAEEVDKATYKAAA